MKYLMMVLCSISLFIVGSTIASHGQTERETRLPSGMTSDNQADNRKILKDDLGATKPVDQKKLRNKDDGGRFCYPNCHYGQEK